MTMGGLWWAISVRSNSKFFAYFIDFFDDLRPALRAPLCTSRMSKER
jgi:hypothetical protein